MLPSYLLQRVYSLHLSQLVAKFHIKPPSCRIHKKGLNLQAKFKYFNDDGGTESFKMNEQPDHHKEIGQHLNKTSGFKSQPLIPLDVLETKGPPKKRTKSTIRKNTSNILFGIHPVSLALQAKRREFNKLYLKKTNRVSPKIEEIQRLAREIEVPVEMVAREKLDKMSDSRPHQGVCLDAGPLNPPFLDLENDSVVHSRNGEESKDPLLWLLINEIIDPMNLGAILRSAYYLGVDRVLGPFNGNCRLSPVVSKASSGILEVINYNYVTDVKELIKIKLSENWDVIGTIIEGPSILNTSVLNVEQYSLKKPSLIIIGNEGDGLHETILNLCTVLLTISQEKGMHHQISLNVSVATGHLK